MKITLLSILVTIALLASPAQANSECSKMKRFVEVMYDAADFLNEKKEFDENPQLEKKLDELITILRVISEHEEDAGFSSSVEAMAEVWEMEEWSPADRNTFRRAFDSTTVALERMYEKQCD